MDASLLRPPLPEGLSHSDIRFVAAARDGLSDTILVAIATALHELVPAGDFSVSSHGALRASAESASPSLWRQAGLLEGLERSTR